MLLAGLPKDVLRFVKRTLFFEGPMSPMDNPEKFQTIMSLLSRYEVDIEFVSWYMCSISTTGVCVLKTYHLASPIIIRSHDLTKQP